MRELKPLKIHSLSTRQSEELVLLCPTESTSEITKVYLEKMIEIEVFYMLLHLCPYMEYLEEN